MSFVKCSAGGCNTRLQPLLKPDPRDKETWVYQECDVCFRPVCEKHSSEVGGQIVCDKCWRERESSERPTDLIDLGLGPLSGSK